MKTSLKVNGCNTKILSALGLALSRLILKVGIAKYSIFLPLISALVQLANFNKTAIPDNCKMKVYSVA